MWFHMRRWGPPMLPRCVILGVIENMRTPRTCTLPANEPHDIAERASSRACRACVCKTLGGHPQIQIQIQIQHIPVTQVATRACAAAPGVPAAHNVHAKFDASVQTKPTRPDNPSCTAPGARHISKSTPGRLSQKKAGAHITSTHYGMRSCRAALLPHTYSHKYSRCAPVPCKQGRTRSLPSIDARLRQALIQRKLWKLWG